MYLQSNPVQQNQQPMQGEIGAQTVPAASANAAFRGGSPKVLAALAIAIVAIVAVGAVALGGIGGHKSNPTVSTTVSPHGGTVVGNFSGCGPISSSGAYTLKSNIKARIQSGACINVTADNVAISCNGMKIEGSGPFDALPPFTYGIRVTGSNVSVNGCTITNFSYGIGAFSSKRLGLYRSNLSSNYVANLYLNATSGSTIDNNTLSGSLSSRGSVYLANGSSSNLLENNMISYNQFYAINVSSIGNRFVHNVMNTTQQYAFYCSVADSYPGSSSASGNDCLDNQGCAFVSCKGTNTPANLSEIRLGSSIDSCGSIEASGDYRLDGDISMNHYLNMQNPASAGSGIPCIRIAAGNVRLDCGGHGIYNSIYPITVSGQNNVTISDCRIYNASGYGISSYSTYNLTISNSIVESADAGIYLQGSYADNVTNVTLSHNIYGIYLNGSRSNNIFYLDSINNSYGVYMIGQSNGNNFYRPTALGNSKIDVYGSAGTSGPQDNLMSGAVCRTTNTKWASCPVYLSASIAYVPLYSCTAIRSGGNYSLQNNIINAQSDCIRVLHSNVTFSCGANRIFANSNVAGYGIGVYNASNVTIESCGLAGYPIGILAVNTSMLEINGVKVQNTRDGIVINSSSGDTLLFNIINGTTQRGIQLINTTASNVRNNSVYYGQGTAVGILLNGSTGNKLLNNSVSQASYGFQFGGASGNNLVSYNTATLSSKADFACDGNSALGAESGGINYGASKIGCYWLAAVQKLATNPACIYVSAPDLVNLKSDYQYTFGTTCFTMSGNHSTINCNGHTIIATNGGTFAMFRNSTGSGIENCYLKGFTTPIAAVGSNLRVYNNTIIDTSGQPAINVSGGEGSAINLNNVSSTGIGIELYSYPYSTLKDNLVYSPYTAYLVSNSLGIQIFDNIAEAGSGNGIVINSTIDGLVQDNSFSSGIGRGIACYGPSTGKGNLSDLGGNSCSGNIGCNWVSQSAFTCK